MLCDKLCLFLNRFIQEDRIKKGAPGPRVLGGSIQHPSGDFEFYGVYLDYSSESHRMRQIGNLLKAISDRKGCNVPILLAGDFNSLTLTDYSPEYFETKIAAPRRAINWDLPVSKLTDMMREKGFVDCWQRCPERLGPVYTCQYDSRIDYVFTNPQVLERFEPFEFETIEMIHGRRLSDHNMILCRFK